ncbi:DUF2889 domain-containing protein [Polaromonas hydrogenivorans]|uniref:DUF2889 domain-containing protein n=1 Tax=Polaromonas hydrogenivorans TaxID=335476 RepID=A0AAU7LYQ8_9BURK
MPVLIQQDQLLVELSRDRSIQSIKAMPDRPATGKLVGTNCGNGLRRAINDALPLEQAAGAPLYLLLDDLAGASLIASRAWSRCRVPGAPQESFPSPQELKLRAQQFQEIVGVCIGFRAGSSALSDFDGMAQNNHPVVDLPNPSDSLGWHPMPECAETSLRRARRIDVWYDGVIHLDAMFQDSAYTPGGTRVGIHEYTLQAMVDPDTLELLSLNAEPRILPYPECPAAPGNITRLLGTQLSKLRRAVPDQLQGELGGTHLNDTLRALAEVPQLSRRLSPSVF